MDKINLLIAENLKRLREERKLSLENVAKKTGISRSMLSQMERGDVNPTISTVWKIANGLKISFTELISRAQKDFEVIDKAEVQPLLEDGGKYRNFPMFQFDSTSRLEIYYIELDKTAFLKADAHPEGTQEFITAFSGKVKIEVDGERLEISDGCSARFKADRPHSYENIGGGICRLSMVICYR